MIEFFNNITYWEPDKFMFEFLKKILIDNKLQLKNLNKFLH